jgi:hypothetical protein
MATSADGIATLSRQIFEHPADGTEENRSRSLPGNS